MVEHRYSSLNCYRGQLAAMIVQPKVNSRTMLMDALELIVLDMNNTDQHKNHEADTMIGNSTKMAMNSMDP